MLQSCLDTTRKASRGCMWLNKVRIIPLQIMRYTNPNALNNYSKSSNNEVV